MKINAPISVVIPIYNEAENINWLFKELYSSLKRNFAEFEIIFVDDGSSDNSLSEIQSISSQYSEVKQVALKVNQGQSKSMLKGIAFSSYNVVAMMDGDGQYDPEDIPRLFNKLNPPYRLISGKRDNRKDSFLYRGSSFIGNYVIAWFFGLKKFDLGCGLKIGYKEDLERIPYFKHVHRYFQIIYIHSGLQVADIEINHRERIKGSSKYSILKVFNILPRLLWLKLKNKRLTNN